MSKASSLYSCLSKTNFSPADLLTQLNNEICETISRGYVCYNVNWNL